MEKNETKEKRSLNITNYNLFAIVRAKYLQFDMV